MALPVEFNTVPVRAKYVDLDGQPVQGTIAFTASVGTITVPGAGTIVVGKTIPIPLINGELEAFLPATDDPDVQPTGFLYTVVEKLVNLKGRTFTITVPIAAAGTGVDLANLVPPETPEEPFQFTVLILDGGDPSSTYTTTTDGGTA